MNIVDKIALGLVDKAAFGRRIMLRRKGETTYKRWQPDPARLEPYSTNPDHQAVFIKHHKHFDVLGRVKRTVLDL